MTGPRSTKFVRGYGFQGGNQADLNFRAPGFGVEFKKAALDPIVRCD